MELLADDITEAEGLLLGGPTDEVVRAPSPQRLARRQPEDDDLSVPRHQHRYGSAAPPPQHSHAYFPTDPRTGVYTDRQQQQLLFGTPTPSSPHPVDLSLPPPFCHVPVAASATRRTQSPRVTPAPPAVPVQQHPSQQQQQQQPRPPHSGGLFDAYGGTPQRGGRAAAAPASLLLYDALGGGNGGQHPLVREETALDELFLLGAAESGGGGNGSVHPAAASQQGASPMSAARGERRTLRRSVSPQRPQQSQGGGGGGGSGFHAGRVEDDAGGRAGSVLSMADELGAAPQTRPSVPATFFRQQARMSHPEL